MCAYFFNRPKVPTPQLLSLGCLASVSSGPVLVRLVRGNADDIVEDAGKDVRGEVLNQHTRRVVVIVQPIDNGLAHHPPLPNGRALGGRLDLPDNVGRPLVGVWAQVKLEEGQSHGGWWVGGRRVDDGSGGGIRHLETKQ